MAKRTPSTSQPEQDEMVFLLDFSAPGQLSVDQELVPRPPDPLTDAAVDPREQVHAGQQRWDGDVDTLYKNQVLPRLDTIRSLADQVAQIERIVPLGGDLGSTICYEVNQLRLALDLLVGGLQHNHDAMKRYTESGAKVTAAGKTSQRATFQKRHDKAMQQYECWQTRAERKWQQNRSLSIYRAAELIAHEIETETGVSPNVNTIRRYIHKPQL